MCGAFSFPNPGLCRRSGSQSSLTRQHGSLPEGKKNHKILTRFNAQKLLRTGFNAILTRAHLGFFGDFHPQTYRATDFQDFPPQNYSIWAFYQDFPPQNCNLPGFSSPEL